MRSLYNRKLIPAVALACLTACAQAALAQQRAEPYPSRLVRIVVGLAPGGATDIQARLYAQKMAEEMGKPFLVENRPGAGGAVAIQALTSAPADGHVLFAATPSFTINAAFAEKASLDPVRDFAPVSLVTKAPYLMVVNTSVPAKSFGEYIAHARSNPDKLNFGTGGPGTPLQLGALWINNAAGVRIAIIPYKGTGPVLTDLMAGQLQATFGNPISTLPLVKSGKLRALAVTTLERSRVLPDLPTIAESGIPGYDVSTWHGWVAAKGTPPDIVNRISVTISKVVRSPDITAKLLAEGGEAVGSTPQQFMQFLENETQRWRKLVKDTGATLD